MKAYCLVFLLVVAGQTAQAQSVNVQDFGAVGDGLTDDTAAFRAAILAAPANGVVLVPATAAYYNLLLSPVVSPAYASVAVISKHLTVMGDGAFARVRLGPEQPSSGGYVLFEVLAGVQLVVNDLTVDGPDIDGGRLFRAFYHRGGTGSITLHRVTATKWGEVVKTDAAASLGSVILTITSCDLQNSNSVGYNLLLVGDLATVRISQTTLTGAPIGNVPNYALYLSWSANLDFDSNIVAGRFGYAIHPEGGPMTAPQFWRVTNSSFIGDFRGTNGDGTGILTNRYTVSLIAHNTFAPINTTGAHVGVMLRGPAIVDSNVFSGQAGPLASTRISVQTDARVGVVSIRNNTFDGNSYVTLNYSTAPVGFTFIVENNTWDNDTTSKLYALNMDVQHGILIVKNNYFRGASTAQVQITTRGDDSELHALNNVFMNTTGVPGTKVQPTGNNRLARYEIAGNRCAASTACDQPSVGLTVTFP